MAPSGHRAVPTYVQHKFENGWAESARSAPDTTEVILRIDGFDRLDGT